MTTKDKKTTHPARGFWVAMKQRYPQVMELFLEWVNSYKLDNHWKQLFNYSLDAKRDIPGLIIITPKFHDLPIAMQMGIFMQFMAEHNPDPEVSDDPMAGAEEFIENELKWMENHGGKSR